MTDDFTLAVLVCRLLTAGDHPFLGHPVEAVSEDPSPDENIRLGLSYLARPAAVRVPTGTVDADVMPPAIAALARQAFGPGIKDPAHRPSAAKWHETLRTEWSATQTCQHRPHHTYGAHLTGCPWCARVTTGKSDPFNPPESAKQKTSKLDKRVLVVVLLLAALFLLIHRQGPPLAGNSRG